MKNETLLPNSEQYEYRIMIINSINHCQSRLILSYLLLVLFHPSFQKCLAVIQVRQSRRSACSLIYREQSSTLATSEPASLGLTSCRKFQAKADAPGTGAFLPRERKSCTSICGAPATHRMSEIFRNLPQNFFFSSLPPEHAGALEAKHFMETDFDKNFFRTLSHIQDRRQVVRKGDPRRTASHCPIVEGAHCGVARLRGISCLHSA